jgi:hypothetical protein
MSPLFIFAYLGYLVAFLHIHVTPFNEPAKLKNATFRLLLIIIPIMNRLSSFSGYTTQPNWSSLIWSFNAPRGKSLWFLLLVEALCWSWT